MKAIIIGAGSAGGVLAERLTEENYDVIVIDPNPASLARLAENLDILTIEGSGADPRVLARAGVEDAALLLAVTDRDEANILACILARNAGVKHRIARIQNPAYHQGLGLIDLSVLGVSLAIDPATECATEMAALLMSPLAQEVARLFDGRVIAATFKIPAGARNLDLPLAQYPNAELIRNLRLIALERNGELLIPDGETRLAVDDFAAVVGTSEQLIKLADDLLPERTIIRKVVIAGGGPIGCMLAQQLERFDKFGLVLLERDPAVAEQCANVLKQTLVLCGDMLSQDLIHTAGITRETAFVSTLADNEANIIASLLATKSGACFSIGRVSKLEYLPIINQVGLLDRTVNPYLSMINAIIHFIRGTHAERVSTLRSLKGEFHEVTVTTKSPLCDKTLRDAKLPRGLIVASLLRGSDIITPTGDITIEAGNRLVIFGLPDAIKKIAPLCKK